MKQLKENNSNHANSSRTNKLSSHPSDESVPHPFKPSIKVGYCIVAEKNEVYKRARKRVESVVHLNESHREGKKIVDKSQYQNNSGFFKDSQYYSKSQASLPHYQRKSVNEAYHKYYESNGVKPNLTNQFKKQPKLSQRPPKNPLPSYQQQGIKNILEYQYAGKYRQPLITDKCTKQKAIQRFFKFNDLHDFDFRKKPQFLR